VAGVRNKVAFAFNSGDFHRQLMPSSVALN
jgi:hypothetical protein